MHSIKEDFGRDREKQVANKRFSLVILGQECLRMFAYFIHGVVKNVCLYFDAQK